MLKNDIFWSKMCFSAFLASFKIIMFQFAQIVG